MAGILRGVLFLASSLGLVLVGTLAALRLEPSTAYLLIVEYHDDTPGIQETEFRTDIVTPTGSLYHRIHAGTYPWHVEGVSPDNHWIYFTESYSQRYRTKSDFSSVEAIDNPFAFGRFSPDGKWIIFTHRTQDNTDLYRMSLDGQSIQRLTFSLGQDFCEAWTPDSDWIIYINATLDGTKYNREVYRMRPDGTNKLNLSNSPAIDEFGAVSGDGQWVIFWSDREGNGEIFRVRIDGTAIQNLTNHVAADGLEFLSPDGEWIYFSSERTGTQHLYRMRIDGIQIERLTRLPMPEFESSNSPDGRQILFRSQNILYKMNANGTQLVPLVSKLDGHYQRVFSPDSKSYYFSTKARNSIWWLYRVNLEDGHVHNLNTEGIITGFINIEGQPWQSTYPLIAWSTALLFCCAWLIRRHRNA